MLWRYCIFYKWKVCSNPVMSHFFSTAFSDFMSLGHILAILIIFHIFSLLSYLSWWFVSNNVCAVVIVLGCHEPQPCKTANFTDRCRVYWLLHYWLFPISLPLLMPSCSLTHNNIETGPINNPTMSSTCSNEKKNHTPFTLSQKLEMIEPSKEGTSEDELGQKRGLLSRKNKLWKQRTSSWRTWRALLQ